MFREQTSWENGYRKLFSLLGAYFCLPPKVHASSPFSYGIHYRRFLSTKQIVTSAKWRFSFPLRLSLSNSPIPNKACPSPTYSINGRASTVDCTICKVEFEIQNFIGSLICWDSRRKMVVVAHLGPPQLSRVWLPWACMDWARQAVSDGNQTSNRCCSACGASSRTNQAPESRCSSEKKRTKGWDHFINRQQWCPTVDGSSPMNQCPHAKD